MTYEWLPDRTSGKKSGMDNSGVNDDCYNVANPRQAWVCADSGLTDKKTPGKNTRGCTNQSVLTIKPYPMRYKGTSGTGAIANFPS